MTRMEMLPTDTADPVVRPVFQRLLQRWGVVLHLYRLLGWSPPLVKAWAQFAWSLRFELGASRRLRELLVIGIARQLGARYEYEHHVGMARDEGITPAQVDALADWRNSALFDPDERLVLQLADELALQPGASAQTMAALQARFSKSDTIELLVTGAYYCGGARVVNSLDLDVEPGHDQLRPRND